MKANQFNPVKGYVFVEQSSEDKKEVRRGLILPPEPKDQRIGIVVACGKDSPVKKGDEIFFKEFSGHEIIIDGVKHQFVKYEDIISTIKES